MREDRALGMGARLAFLSRLGSVYGIAANRGGR